ncbi:hypothetical protein BI364_02230 [Acidihalobacter yilgarnensis]|uniref:TonB C-terminal domain-containing protein n=1 Tax=Acidihalobacter yilgarnensis TaxID=2819280 RepID=A0A1D8IKI9_9GAMM|nr:TonB family protein [Acidihalobacter yilgarnensis]AOU96982.1 hypothetical protein BI364_02230 [Acidihalobacter yilgarnensis]
MSTQAAWGYSPPDDPMRRLFWVVPLALLLVIVFVLGIGHWLVRSAPAAKPPPPVDARIYELPPSRSAMFSPKSGKPATHTPSHAPTHAAQPPAPPPQHAARPAPKPSAPRASAPPSESAGQPEPRVSLPAKPQQTPSPHPAPRAAPTKPLNWAKLNQQINEAVASTISRSELPQIHDPHTLVARFYLATVLRKLQRIGDMNYPGDLVGDTRVMVIIGRQGELIGYKLLDSSGNPALDQVAGNIVHMSAPFAPFPEKMGKQTSRVKLVITMHFEGYRNLNPE